MKTTKKAFVLLLALFCIGATIIPAHATEAQPMTDTANKSALTLTINSSGQASCFVVVNTRTASNRVEVSMSLNQINGKAPLKTWSLSGTGSFSATKTYYVVKGYDYQITAKITVKDSSGKLIESFTTNSSVVRY